MHSKLFTVQTQHSWRSLARWFEDILWHFCRLLTYYYIPNVVEYSALGARDLGFLKLLKFSLLDAFFYPKWAKPVLVLLCQLWPTFPHPAYLNDPDRDFCKPFGENTHKMLLYMDLTSHPYSAVDSLRTTKLYCWFSSPTFAVRSAIAWCDRFFAWQTITTLHRRRGSHVHRCE